MNDVFPLLQTTIPGVQTVAAVLLVGVALVALFGGSQQRFIAQRLGVLLAVAVIGCGLAAWYSTMLGPFQDPGLLHRLWLPLAAVALAGATAVLPTVVRARLPRDT